MVKVNNPLFAGAPPVVASYDYTDIIAGTGIQEFYLGTASGAFVLSNKVFYSEKTMIDTTQAGTADGYILETDFDVILNLPKIMKGTAVMNVPFGVQSGSAGYSFNGYPRVKIRKVSGGTETEVAEGSGSNIFFPSLGVNVYGYAMGLIQIDVPSTHFKKGDTIRLTVEIHYNNSNGAGKWFFGCDPQNRATTDYNGTAYPAGFLTWGTDPSIFTAQLPFKIDTT